MEISQHLLAIGLVLAVFVLAAFAAHRRGWLRLNLPVRSGPLRQLELIDRFALTAQHQLHFIRVGDRRLLIATHPKGLEIVESGAASAGVAGHGGRR